MFTGSHIVITGGSSGLGMALASALAARGACLSLLARDPENLRAAMRAIERQHPGAHIRTHSVDVTDAQAVAQTIERCVEAGGPIDMLFNNAGVMREGPFETLNAERFREVMEVNFFGVETVTRAALPYLKASRGRLVNVASVAGLTGAFGFSAYAAAKHALVGFTDSLYYELKPQRVTVHLVCPSEFESAMVMDLNRSRSPQNRAHVGMIPRVELSTVVRDTLLGVRRGRYRIVPGGPTRLVVLAMRWFPSVARWLVDLRLNRSDLKRHRP